MIPRWLKWSKISSTHESDWYYPLKQSYTTKSFGMIICEIIGEIIFCCCLFAEIFGQIVCSDESVNYLNPSTGSPLWIIMWCIKYLLIDWPTSLLFPPAFLIWNMYFYPFEFRRLSKIHHQMSVFKIVFTFWQRLFLLDNRAAIIVATIWSRLLL